MELEMYRPQITILIKRRKKSRKIFLVVMAIFWISLLAMAFTFKDSGFFPAGWIMIGFLALFSVIVGVILVKTTSGTPENPRVVSVLQKREVIRRSSDKKTKHYYFYAMVDGHEQEFPCELIDYYQMEVGTKVLLVDFRSKAGVATDSILLNGNY